MAARRSKRRPPSGERCDIHVGLGEAGPKHTYLKRCPEPATVELLGAAPVGETWVCEKHAEHLLKKSASPAGEAAETRGERKTDGL